MFKMIGGDGREYGPVTADQLRLWILDHRANGQTMVQPVGSLDWVPLGSLPEFAEALASAAQPHGVPPPKPLPVVAEAEAPTPFAPVVAPVAAGELHIFDCLERAWLLLQRHFLLIAGAALVVWGVQTLSALGGCAGGLVRLAISGPLYGGLSVLVLGLARGRSTGLGDLFACFGERFLPCLAIWLVTEILSQLGLALCLLPGIFLSVVWAFSLPLTADRGLGFGEAIRTSWRAVLPRFFTVLGLLALAFLPVVVFAAYSSVTMAVHAMDVLGPVGAFDFARLQEKLPELASHAARIGFQQQMVLLLNLPFAWAALMTAYEDLFGRRSAQAA